MIDYCGRGEEPEDTAVPVDTAASRQDSASPSPPGDTPPEPSAGCGCRSAGAEPSLIVLVWALVGSRRRRRVPPQRPTASP